MIMTRETSAAAMLDMAAVDLRDVSQTYGLDTSGGQPLPPRIKDGVKVFDLVTSCRWTAPSRTRMLSPSAACRVPLPCRRAPRTLESS
jgi:hypothetical protein